VTTSKHPVSTSASPLELLELLPVPAVLIGSDWTMLDWNSAAVELFGPHAPMTPGAFLGRALACSLAGPRGRDCGRVEACTDCPARSTTLEALATDRRATGVDLEIPQRSGAPRHFELGLSPVPLPSGPGVLMTLVERRPAPVSPCESGGNCRGYLEALQRMGELKLGSDQAPLATAVELAVQATGSTIGYLHLLAPDGEHLVLNAWSQATMRRCTSHPQEHYPLSRAGIWADCVRQDGPVIHNDYQRIQGRHGLPEGHVPLSNHMSVPVRDRGRITAILGVGNREAPYHAQDAQLLELLAEAMWAIVQRHRVELRLRDTVQRLRRLLGGTVEAITRAVEMGDPATAGHQRRVSDLARSIATELGLPPRQVDAIRLAAMLHDIGKLAIPSDILSKPARLSQAQMALVRQHAALGAEILEPIAYPEGLSRVVAQHHERMDGSGYPEGLSGDAICVEARVIAVADVVEAMLSHRPYRPAHDLEATLWEIRQRRAKQLDRHAVDACLRLFEAHDYRFPDERD
jgi:putative nucleotidyltransferase with HDIG domain